MPPRPPARTALENVGNFVTVAGALLLFNGFFMTILGFMTVLGITTEELAKWHEIGVTPEQSDQLGLLVLGVGLVVFVVGRLLAKSGKAAAA